ncbi:MAG TPA: carboxypeptidase-like regulatory domain-containing protein, partial [Pyrinomonadaceae bacterium]
MNTSRCCTILFLISILGTLAPEISAQDLDTVSITGVVTDEHNAVIVGAEVVATFSKSGATRKALTDGSGRFRLIQLEPGSYSLAIACAGFV